MKKAVTMPTTAREMEQHLASLPLHRRLRAATALETSTPASDTPRRAAQSPSPLGVTGLSLLRSLRRDSAATLVAPRRALSTASFSTVEHLHGDGVFAGWLCVEHRLKREFVWRYCVLDDAALTCYKDETPGARVVLEHVIGAVERLTQLNRALVLVSRSGYRLWVHVDHEQSNLERWHQLFAAAVDRQARHRDGSIFLRKAAAPAPSVPAALTGWVLLRKTRLSVAWLWSRPRRMYCVLTGTTLAGFVINMEGRWADFYGCVTHMSAEDEREGKEALEVVQWIELRFENAKTRVRLAAVAPEQTWQWRDRIRVALKAR